MNFIDFLPAILKWANDNYKHFKENGYGRQYGILQELNPPNKVWEIKKQIMDLHNLHNAKQEPIYKDYCGYITDGGAIHEHIDPNETNLTHTRFNVLVSKPLSGGEPIQDGKVIEVKEGEMWRCEAGKLLHSCKPVIGVKPRIVLSFGFLI